MLKAITVWQPLAGAMALGLKRNETRGRRCFWRGELAIHAASGAGWKRGDAVDNLRAVLRIWGRCDGNEDLFVLSLTPGSILCVVDLYDCVPTNALLAPGRILLERRPDFDLSDADRALGDYSPGRFALLTRNLRVLRKPVPCRGQQAVPWTVPPEIEAEVRRQLP